MSESETTALEVIPKESALAVLTNAEKFDEFFERVAKEVRGVEPDLTTAAGRKAVAALAFKVTKSKTAIVAAADLLTEDARAQIKKVNESKKEIEERLDALKKEVRKPLTDWEAAEEARETACRQGLASLELVHLIIEGDTSETVSRRIDAAKAINLDPDIYREMMPIAEARLSAAIQALEARYKAAVRAEADAAELAALRAKDAERDAADAKRREEEAATDEARKVEEKRKQDEEDQRERNRLAEEQRDADAKVAKEQQEARDAQIAKDAAEAERKRIADEAETKRQADEKRAANVKHQAKVMGEAKVAIMTVFPIAMHADEKEAFAKSVVSAIVRGEIPHTTIKF